MGARQPSPRIDATLRSAARKYGAVRACEGLLLGLTAAGLTAAAAILSGAAPGESGPLAAAVLAGAFCAATWWLERRKTPGQLARKVDVATSGDGAFVTAVECAERGAPGALESALVERTSAAVRPRDARRAIASPALAFVAAPLVAAALVAFLLEVRPPGQRPAASGALGALSVALAGAAGEGQGGELDPELARLLDRALEVAERPGRPAGLESALEELEQALERRALEAGLDAAGSGDAGSDPDRAAELRRAASLARAARREAGEHVSSPDSGGSAGGPGLAAGASGTTMGGSPDGTDIAGDPAGAAPGERTPEAGLLAGRTWDEQYDGIVSAWVLRGAAAAELDTAPDSE